MSIINRNQPVKVEVDLVEHDPDVVIRENGTTALTISSDGTIILRDLVDSSISCPVLYAILRSYINAAQEVNKLKAELSNQKSAMVNPHSLKEKKIEDTNPRS